MTTEKMNVHRALCELKVLESRITKEISNQSNWAVANKHNNKKINGLEIDHFCAGVKSSYESVTDLIKRKNAIKQAVVLSNAFTKEKVAGVEYTVAEIIEMKNHGLDLQNDLLRSLESSYKRALHIIELGNGTLLEEKAEKYVVSLYGNSDKTKNEEAQKAKETYIEQNSIDLIDPINILDKINELKDKRDSFLTEVDSVLSTSNALTIIEITY